MDITIDYYRIAIDRRIVLSGNFTAPPIAILLAPFGANSARFFTNAIYTQTNGVDATANYRLALRNAGDVQLRASYNQTRSRSSAPCRRHRNSRPSRPSCSIASKSDASNAVNQRTACGSAAIGAAHRFGVNVDVARYGEFCSFTLNPDDDQTYPAKWLTDVEASYLPAGYTLAMGVQNLFNVFPGRNTTVNSFNGIQTFPSHSPFGMNGRAIYARVGRTF